MADADPWAGIVERHFRVYERRTEAIGGIGDARLYFLMFPAEELEARYDAVRTEIRAQDEDVVVFLRSEGGEDVLVVAPRPPVAPQGTRANWILLAATIVTTVMAGAIYWHGYGHVGEDWSWAILWSPEHVGMGALTFALPLMAILGLHEGAHYVAARRHGLRATLPYFIPFPPMLLPIGTLGAFIRLKDPLPDRKALFDVGASGPIAGFILAVPLLLLGAYLTTSVGVPVPDLGAPELDIDVPHSISMPSEGEREMVLVNATAGTAVLRLVAPEADWAYTATAHWTFENGTDASWSVGGMLDEGAAGLHTLQIPGNLTAAVIEVTWDDHLLRFGDPLIVTMLEWGGFDGSDYLTHPTFFAAWVGMLVTGINLIPAGQLDGGHIARAVFGDRMRFLAYGAVGGLFWLALKFQTWILMALFIVLMGLYHPPPLNDRVQLDLKRKVIAGVVLVIFALSFVPRPIIL